jgi:hypothetical protein
MLMAEHLPMIGSGRSGHDNNGLDSDLPPGMEDARAGSIEDFCP